jgi:hypothetical protein
MTLSAPLQDTKVDVKIKLAGLWASTLFCYIYGDYFELYVPGKLAGMLSGQMVPLGPVTQGVLLGTTIMLAVQCVMVCLSLLMKPALNRWVNVIFGLVCAAIVGAVITQSGWVFYQLLGVIEIALLLAIVWQAWTWPRVRAAGN